VQYNADDARLCCAPQIFVSYVQVVGIMRTLQLDWPPYLQRIVNSVDISSSANYISMECSLGRMNSLTKAIFQTSSIVVLPGEAPPRSEPCEVGRA
jgi:hypothetical protein